MLNKLSTIKIRIMKKFKAYYLLIFSGAIFFSCDTKEDEIMQNDLTFSELEIPSEISYGNNLRNTDVEIGSVTLDVTVMLETGEEVLGQVKVTYPVNDDNYLLSFELTDNIINALGPDHEYWSELHSQDNQRLLQSSCIASCHTAYTDSDGNKIKGRGWCKAGCWASIGIAAAAVIVAAVA